MDPYYIENNMQFIFDSFISKILGALQPLHPFKSTTLPSWKSSWRSILGSDPLPQGGFCSAWQCKWQQSDVWEGTLCVCRWTPAPPAKSPTLADAGSVRSSVRPPPRWQDSPYIEMVWRRMDWACQDFPKLFCSPRAEDLKALRTLGSPWQQE